MASIADAITFNVGPEKYYADAGNYLDALAEYVGILNSDMDFTAAESITFVAGKYIVPLADGQSVNLSAFIGIRLAALGGS
jgi:hypothetical protein